MTLFEQNQKAAVSLHADLLEFQAYVARAHGAGNPIKGNDLSLLFHKHNFAVTYEASADSKHRYIECRLLHSTGSLLSSGLLIADGIEHYEAMKIARNTVIGLAS